jgi:beta-fructofuranosidase
MTQPATTFRETPTRPNPVPADWLTFHLAHPGPSTAMPGDPNCAFFYGGRYHLHYIYRNDEGFAFAHISSSDLVRWRWHPTTLTPSQTGHGMYSGTGFLSADGKPAIIYHGEGSARNQIAIAEDDQLECWSKPWPVEPRVRPDQDGSTIANWDPDAWREGDVYYALSGGNPGSGKPPTLFKSLDLKTWDFLGLFLTKDMPDVLPDEDISCPNFFPIGNKHMLLCISHTLGCRYYLGEWKNERFTPDFHARMNWNKWDCFAPESVITADGRRVMWTWCNLDATQSGIQSLPRELSLPADGVLRIKPLRELETLRDTVRHATPKNLDPAAPTTVLRGFLTNACELRVVFAPGNATTFGIMVYGGLAIVIEPANQTLRVGQLSVPLALARGTNVDLRVFLDGHMVEVFANDRQAVIVSHPPIVGESDLGLFCTGGAADPIACTRWTLRSIYETV